MSQWERLALLNWTQRFLCVGSSLSGFRISKLCRLAKIDGEKKIMFPYWLKLHKMLLIFFNYSNVDLLPKVLVLRFKSPHANLKRLQFERFATEFYTKNFSVICIWNLVTSRGLHSYIF
jgi:hypothetical protein